MKKIAGPTVLISLFGLFFGCFSNDGQTRVLAFGFIFIGTIGAAWLKEQ